VKIKEWFKNLKESISTSQSATILKDSWNKGAQQAEQLKKKQKEKLEKIKKDKRENDNSN